LFAQVFKAAAPENVCKLLSHKDQTRLTVDDAYQTFFTEHRVEQDKRQATAINVHAVEDNQGHDAPYTDPNVAAFHPQQPQQQQRFHQQQQQGYNNHGNRSRGQNNYRGNNNRQSTQNQGSNASRNGKTAKS
jgi:hypothetical protein